MSVLTALNEKQAACLALGYENDAAHWLAFKKVSEILF